MSPPHRDTGGGTPTRAGLASDEHGTHEKRQSGTVIRRRRSGPVSPVSPTDTPCPEFKRDEMTFLVLTERGADGGYGASVPDLPGVLALGDTPEEALSGVREAIAVHLLALKATGGSVPDARHRCAIVEVDTSDVRADWSDDDRIALGQELDRRYDDIESGRVMLAPGEEVFAGIRAKIDAHRTDAPARHRG